MQDKIEQEINKMIQEMQELETIIAELNYKGARMNEDISSTIEVLKKQIENVADK